MASDTTKKRPRGDLLASLDAAFAAKQAAPASKYTAQAAQAQAQANSQQAYLHTKRKKKSKSSSGAGGGNGQHPKQQQQQPKQQQQQQQQQPVDPLYGKLSVDLLRVGLKNCSLLPQAKTLSRQYVLSATLKSYLDAATQNGGKSVDAAADKLKNKVLQLDNPVKTTDKAKLALGTAQAQTAKLLSARQRRQLGLHLLKGEMPFSDAEQLCAIWRRYARDVLAVDGGDPADEAAQNLRVQSKLKTLELSGCPVEVIRSQNPCVVGVCGVVVAEKQQVLQLCTPSNKIITLPKLGSRFRVALDAKRAVLIEGAWLLQRAN